MLSIILSRGFVGMILVLVVSLWLLRLVLTTPAFTGDQTLDVLLMVVLLFVSAGGIIVSGGTILVVIAIGLMKEL